jgi:hypothetical protein
MEVVAFEGFRDEVNAMGDSQTGWRNAATAEVAEGIRSDPFLRLETLDRINHLASDLSFEETVEQAGNEVAATWLGRELAAPKARDIDWDQLGESFLLEVLGHDRNLGR